MFFKSKAFKLIVISCFALALISCVGITTAYYIHTAAPLELEILVGKDVSINVNKFEQDSSSPVLPGEKINMKAVSITANNNITNCYIRVKVELLGENANNLILNSTVEGKENTILLQGAAGYNWVLFEDYYYLTADNALNQDLTNLYEVQANQTFNLQVKDILVDDSLVLTDAAEQTNIKLTVQAIQSTNYDKDAWSEQFGE